MLVGLKADEKNGTGPTEVDAGFTSEDHGYKEKGQGKPLPFR